MHYNKKYKEILDIINKEIKIDHFLMDKNLDKYNLSFSSEIRDSILTNIKNKLNYLGESNIGLYNCISNNFDSIEYIENDNNIDGLKLNDLTFSTIDNLQWKDVNLLIYKISSEHNTNNIFILKKLDNKLKFLKKGIYGYLIKGRFSKISDPMLYLDDSIDLVIYGKSIFIINHMAYERVFDVYDQYKQQAEDILNKTKLFKEKIENFENFKNEALSNKAYQRRLAKLKSNTENDPTLFLENIKQTKKIVEDFDLDLSIKNEKIVYDNSTQISSIISLMQDAYYKTLIGDKNGIDNSR